MIIRWKLLKTWSRSGYGKEPQKYECRHFDNISKEYYIGDEVVLQIKEIQPSSYDREMWNIERVDHKDDIKLFERLEKIHRLKNR